MFAEFPESISDLLFHPCGMTVNTGSRCYLTHLMLTFRLLSPERGAARVSLFMWVMAIPIGKDYATSRWALGVLLSAARGAPTGRAQGKTTHVAPGAPDANGDLPSPHVCWSG